MKDFEIPTGNAHRKQTGNKTDLPGRNMARKVLKLAGKPELAGKIISASR